MNPVELIALAASTSLLAGWRLYLVTLVTGLAMKFGWIALPEQLHSLDILANNLPVASGVVLVDRNRIAVEVKQMLPKSPDVR